MVCNVLCITSNNNIYETLTRFQKFDPGHCFELYTSQSCSESFTPTLPPHNLKRQMTHKSNCQTGNNIAMSTSSSTWPLLCKKTQYTYYLTLDTFFYRTNDLGISQINTDYRLLNSIQAPLITRRVGMAITTQTTPKRPEPSQI